MKKLTLLLGATLLTCTTIFAQLSPRLFIKVGKAGVFITKDINYSGRHRLDSTLLKNPAAAGLGLIIQTN